MAYYWSINTAETAVSLSAHPSPLVITTKLAADILGGDCSEEEYCPCGADLSRSNLVKTTGDSEGHSIDMTAYNTSTTTIQNDTIYKCLKYCRLDMLIYHYHANKVITKINSPHNERRLNLRHHELLRMIFWQTEKSS